ncbi:MAG: glycyl-radical enzyme activating protein [Chloroflexi bacterium]|nr:glycyl-radical enzyme activating protein [Chloroflexota bacterium]
MTDERDTRGVIFNVQHYSIHDGPGIRTTVFLKGCPLHCLWCQNPESQAVRPELFFNAERCQGCAKCVDVCPEHAIEIVDGKSRTNRAVCKTSGECAQVCPNDARNVMGKYVTAGQVFKQVSADAIFYQRSGGGMTISGGEPLTQPQFAISLLKLCRDAAIHTTIDTCGYATWDSARRVLENVDLVLYDFKHMDPSAHKKLTGVSNELILDNAKKIVRELSLPMFARVPIAPGLNDSLTNLRATAQFIATELGDSVKVHLLPYHRLGEAKYERLEKPSQSISIDPPNDERVFELQKIFESFGLTTIAGG